MKKKDIRKKIEKNLKRADEELLAATKADPKDRSKSAAFNAGLIAAYRNALRWFE
jgi:hypothetical protein